VGTGEALEAAAVTATGVAAAEEEEDVASRTVRQRWRQNRQKTLAIFVVCVGFFPTPDPIHGTHGFVLFCCAVGGGDRSYNSGGGGRYDNRSGGGNYPRDR